MDLPAFIHLMNTRYLAAHNTVLTGGFEEPFYAAAKYGNPAYIRFTREYFRSALHELAHWCVAGEARRRQDDFGYWYAPDGRSQAQQDEFYRMEVKPQAIEWAFSLVVGIPFDVSVDNLENDVQSASAFKENVRQQLTAYILNGFPKRAHEILLVMYQHHFRDTMPVGEYLLSRLDTMSMS